MTPPHASISGLALILFCHLAADPAPVVPRGLCVVAAVVSGVAIACHLIAAGMDLIRRAR